MVAVEEYNAGSHNVMDRSVGEIAFNALYKVVDFRVEKFLRLGIRGSGKVARGTTAERLRHEPRIPTRACAHTNFFDERH